MSDMFDFEELIADMLDISDEAREDDNAVIDAFQAKFNIDYDDAYSFAVALLDHVIPVESGLLGTAFRAFVSKDRPVILMRKKV